MSQSVPGTGVPTCYRHPGRETYIRCQRCGKPVCPDCMHEAAVGFQCADCVAEGRKSTRSGRTAYGGLRPTNASITTGVLIAINVAVWLAVTVNRQLIGVLALWRDDNRFLIGRTPVEVHGVSDGAYWELITSAFTHEQVWHIGFNMLALWVLGPQLELALGRVRFVALYLVSALAGSALVYATIGPYSYTLGASGAVFGMLGALLVLAIKGRGDVRGVLTWVGINFVFTFLVSNISWQGHLGGFIGGLLAAGILAYAPRQNRAVFQACGLLALTALLALAVIARSASLV